METGLRLFLLSACGWALGGCAMLHHFRHHGPPPAPPPQTDEQAAQADQAEADQAPPRVIEPEVERRKIKVPKIDSQNVELGGFVGALSIEDFGTNPVYGVTAAYHVTEDF